MKNFKEYLTEGTTGKKAWEKYFAFRELDTETKKETPFFSSVSDRNGVKTLPKGVKLRVHYTNDIKKNRLPVTLTDTNEDGFLHVDSLRKPGVTQNQFDLKPDQLLNLIGDEARFKPAQLVRDLEKQLPGAGIASVVQEYLLMLARHQIGLASDKDVTEAWQEIDPATRRTLIRSVNKDYLELIGALHAFNKMRTERVKEISLPVRGNEPLKDFDLVVGGKPERKISFSSKTKTKTTNVLKPSLIIKSILKSEGASEIMSSFRKEYELMVLIDTNTTKNGSRALAEFLNKYRNARIDLSEFDQMSDSEKVDREYKYIDMINKMRLNLDGLVQAAVPELVYIKGEVSVTTGLPFFDIRPGQKIENVVLRSKNARTGRMKDKIGLQL